MALVPWFERVRVDGDCLRFIGGMRKRGYAYVWINHRRFAVHRLAYERAFGPITTDQLVCHICDVRDCVNPAHFFLGDNAANAADRDRKGRQRPLRGEANGRAKLTAEQVDRIRSRHRSGGISYAVLGREYGVSAEMISFIVRERNWKPDFGREGTI